ncbi:MAG TPA: CocE/NonD family hydrolase [Bacteroidota bacterium]|nr:CocE/NonD family hydrolase [Bacteroidota bacterium]
MKSLLSALVVCLLSFTPLFAQQLEFNSAAASDEAAVSKALPGLAKQVIAVYKDDNRQTYLNNLFRLQIIAGNYSKAIESIKSFRDILRASDPVNANVVYTQYELYADAKLRQTAENISFDQAFKQSFREIYGNLSDKNAYIASTSFSFDVPRAQSDLQKLLDAQKEKDSIGLNDAIALIRTYQPYLVYKNILPMTDSLLKEDDARRYIIQDDVLIKTKDGATLSAFVVRKRGLAMKQPTALIFNIYTDLSLGLAKISASYGYVGVTVETRGKRNSPDPIEPYEHEVDDTYEAIDWIIKQPWSDGQVGMYSNSYGGYTSWAATKKLHPALKTIAPSAANNPGDGLPMENNVFLFVNYAWAFYVTNNRLVDNETYFDRKRWNDLNDKWYQSGKSYRDIDKVDGTPNKWLQRWLDHPAYDSYWQAKAPYQTDFSKINIPVLTVTGYYDDGQQSALYYLKQHYKFNKNADHYLVIGPYSHFGAGAFRKDQVLNGYAIDSVAQLDTPDLTFAWFDYVMRGGKKPALLKDKINYEVMGTNEWRHAPSLEKMSNQTLKLYLTDMKSGEHYELAKDKPAKSGFLEQTVDFADRKTSNNDYYPDQIIGKKPDLSNGYSFISEPFDAPVSINGTFSGEIKASINKNDMDVGVVLYEVLPDGKLFHLSYIIERASYAKDMTKRNLLTPGKVESIPFNKTRMVSRQLSKGSRLLVTLNVNKNAYAQINYGTGKDVSDEDISDAKVPLQIKWQNDSYVKIPIWR